MLASASFHGTPSDLYTACYRKTNERNKFGASTSFLRGGAGQKVCVLVVAVRSFDESTMQSWPTRSSIVISRIRKALKRNLEFGRPETKKTLRVPVPFPFVADFHIVKLAKIFGGVQRVFVID